MNGLRVESLRVEGIEDLRRALDGADTTSVPLDCRAPTGTVTRAAAGDLLLSTGQWSANVRTRGTITTNLISLGVKLDLDSKHFSFRSRKEVLPGDVYALARGDDVDYRVSGSISYAFVSLSPGLLLAHGGEDSLREDLGFWEKRRWVCASPAMRTLIARSVQRLVKEVLRADCTVTGEALRQLQVELVEPFLWAFMFDGRKAHERHGLSGAAIVRSVENWVDGQAPQSVQLADLCRALRLPRRSLQRAFTEVLGIGPARYLTLKRLTAVRDVLRKSDPDSTTVTDAATKHGFWELSRFARDYRRTFGENPSDTLGKRATRSR